MSAFDVLDSALNGMVRGPRSLAPAISFAAEQLDLQEITIRQLLKHMKSIGPGGAEIGLFRKRLAHWDNEIADWSKEVERNTRARRDLVYKRLDLDEEWRDFCESELPFQPIQRPTVIAEQHSQWYFPEVRRGNEYYWLKYVEQLEAQGWPEDSIIQLEDSTTSIVERLADPTGVDAWQSKGLVVGYVQSGKTANFTGVVAKAADAGYRLIIVLAGMLDVLRSQTQRRLDKELVGKELLAREYISDPDWGDFLQHGARPSELGAFDFSRLTGPESDYRSLAYALDALKFDRKNSQLAFNHPDNLFSSPARIAILKKNPAVINKIIKDLNEISRHRVGAPLEEIPVLIIDDESDQASINTKKQSASSVDEDRTKTNKAIVNLLTLLPRAQYVGYTATPFANVFVDPASEADIFPKDFLIALPRPTGYMGVSDFYDLDAGDGDPTPNKDDYIRPLVGNDDSSKNLQKAIDSFVLSGAIKLWRSAQNPDLRYRHHTMLAHISQKTDDHRDLAKLVKATYGAAAYDGGVGLERLEKLFNTDFARVSRSRGADLPFPNSFEELDVYLGNCISRIGEANDAVLIVNTKNKDQTPDFDKQPVWKILVGGTKLSRGYTVEGLTTSYYRRRTGAGDTLMQMGRWFGFRRGYQDLVRLFIGTEEPNGRGKTINLYEAFGGVCKDEEFFREQLTRYASLEEPRITPSLIPPLVPMHMLRPTSTNKMRNAIVKSANFGGQLSERTYAPTDRDYKVFNNDLMNNFLSGAVIQEAELAATVRGRDFSMSCLYATRATEDVITLLKNYKWYDPRSAQSKDGNPMHLQIEFLQKKNGDHEISDWLFVSPRIKSPLARHTLHGKEFDVVYRSRHNEAAYRFNTYNDPKHREIAEHICGKKNLPNANSDLNAISSPHRGVFLYYPVTESRGKKKDPVSPPYTTAFTLLFPKNSIRSAMTFAVRRDDAPPEAVVSSDD